MKIWKYHLLQLSIIILTSANSYSCINTGKLSLTGTSTSSEIGWWKPEPDNSYQIQYDDLPIDLSVEADVYSVDLFETPAKTIQAIHQAGAKVLCYLNAGAWEEYRPDAGDFPKSVIGSDYAGWPGEKWLDIRNYHSFAHIIQARMDLAVEKGCDGVDLDNLQNYDEDTGFPIEAGEQLAYNKWLSEQAHARGLAISLKNAPDLVFPLVDDYDLAVAEDCLVYGFCDAYKLFIEKGKPFFMIEYTDQFSDADAICSTADEFEYYGMRKNRNLGSWRENCPK